MQPHEPIKFDPNAPHLGDQVVPATVIEPVSRPVLQPSTRPLFTAAAANGPNTPLNARVPLMPAQPASPTPHFAKNVYTQENPKHRLTFGQQIRWALIAVAFVALATAAVIVAGRLLGQNGEGAQNNAIQEQDLSNGDLIVEDVSQFDLPLSGEALIVNGDIVTRGGLKFYNDDFVSSILQSSATAERTVTLPDADGTFCLDVNNCNFATAIQFNAVQAQVDGIEIPDAGITSIQAGSNITVTDLGGGVVSLSSTGGALSVALGTETTGDYVSALGAVTGLTVGANTGEGSAPTISINYGSTANTAVQGNTVLTCATGTGNVTGGGNLVTLGAGGSCDSLTVVANPSFTSLTLSTALGAASGGTGNSFTSFSGPATTVKAFTLPNASATILTSNAAVTAAQGGTGQVSYAVGDLLYASGATSLSRLADVATGNALLSGGVGVAPAWGKIGLTTHVSGVLPVANGGTNANTAQGAINSISGLTNNGDLLYHNGTNAVRLARGSDTQCLTSNTTTILWGSCGDPSSVAQNGNSFTAAMTIGTNDNFGLNLEVANTTVASFSNTGQALFKNTTNSTTAFQVQNAASTSVLRVDTTNSAVVLGLSVSLTPEAGPSLSNTFTLATLESTNTVGQYSSLAMGADGFARIAYFDDTDNDLEFIQCTNTSCSTKNTATVDATNNMGMNTSMVLGADGFARIAYLDAFANSVKFAQCTNASCSTSNLTIVDTNAGSFISVALGADGFVRIAYQTSGATEDVKFIQCTNASCSTRNTSTVDSVGAVGQYVSVAVGADGFARIAYQDVTNSSLKFAQCTNAACSTSVITTIDNDNSEYASVAMASDGFARIAYYHQIPNRLQYVQCTNASCSTNVSTILDATNSSGPHNDLALGADGFARISYYDQVTQDLEFIQCTNIDCSAKINLTVDTTGDVGHYSSIAIGSDGLTRIAYYDNTNGDLEFAYPATTSYLGGSSLGTTSNYFTNLYTANLFAKNTTVTGFDLAENYHITDMSIAAGDIVSSVSGTMVEKGSKTGNTKAIGVVSTKPGITLSEWENDGSTRAIALAGRVPVKVTGPIAVGDYITLSDIPGVGTKAIGPGTVLGMALTAYSGEDQGTVELFVNVYYYEPTIEDLIQGDGGDMAAVLTMQGSLSIGGDLNVSGQTTLTTLTVSTVTITGNLTVGGHIITSGSTPAIAANTTDLGAATVTIEGNDTAGTIRITPAQATTGGKLAEITFNLPFTAGKKPRIVLGAANKLAAEAQAYTDKTTASHTSFELFSAQGLQPGQEYIIDYWVVE